MQLLKAAASGTVQMDFSPYGNTSDIQFGAPLMAQAIISTPIFIVVFAFISSGFVTYSVDDRACRFIHQVSFQYKFQLC